MIKKITNCFMRDFIVAKKIILISLAVVLTLNVLIFLVEPDDSINGIAKAIIISSMIMNLWVVSYGFRQEELPGYKYIMRMADISIPIQIVARFILFLILPAMVLLVSLFFNMFILAYVFAGVLLTTGLSVFIVYLLGTKFIAIPFGMSYAIVNLVTTTNSVKINLNFSQIVIFSLLIYLFIALITILCEKLGWNTYSKIPKY